MVKAKNEITINSMDTYIHECRLKMGDSIRQIREKKGYNQEQLAERMHISRSTISKIESGKFNCSIDYLSKFSAALGFNIVLEEANNEEI